MPTYPLKKFRPPQAVPLRIRLEQLSAGVVVAEAVLEKTSIIGVCCKQRTGAGTCTEHKGRRKYVLFNSVKATHVHDAH